MLQYKDEELAAAIRKDPEILMYGLAVGTSTSPSTSYTLMWRDGWDEVARALVGDEDNHKDLEVVTPERTDVGEWHTLLRKLGIARACRLLRHQPDILVALEGEYLLPDEKREWY